MSSDAGSKSIVHTLAGSMTKRAVAPVAGTAAAAGTTYVARKWHDTIAPAIETRGGLRAVLADALETVAEKAPAPLSPPIRDLARYVSGNASESASKVDAPAEASAPASNDDREAEREERRKRREQRQQALQRSGTS